ncbi:hypothetical protein ACJMK2_021163 [Sinanodonta woodiana]|uniref:Uncharacterized protein n=1 Tax=Sinanodonta woodiana TaxID=1069815 RepID=A0ABD3U3N1_SINWO
MRSVLVTISLVLQQITCESYSGDYSGQGLVPGDPRLCVRDTDKHVLRFETLLGGGWDNLRNKEMGRMTDFFFFFFIPDGLTIIPVKISEGESFAELFLYGNNYKSTLSRSINV